MNVEIFETRREFNKKYPSKIYICSRCGNMVASPFCCLLCSWQSNGLFKESNNTYKYIIKSESEEIFEIFRPIELQKTEGEKNEQTGHRKRNKSFTS